MMSLKKNKRMKKGNKMEAKTEALCENLNENSDEEQDEVISNFAGLQLLYFEHSYIQNSTEMFDKSSPAIDQATVQQSTIPEPTESQVPIRRSQRQINKLENVPICLVEKIDTMPSPVKPKMCTEEKSKEDIQQSESNASNINLSTVTNPMKYTPLKKEVSNAVSETVSSCNTKILPKKEVALLLSPSKTPKKGKSLDTKGSIEKELKTNMKRRLSGKDESSATNLELKKKDVESVPLIESRRKRAFSEPSKNDLCPLNVDDPEIKSKKLRCLAKNKSSALKTKRSEKLSPESSNLKKRKRNMSAPSDKIEIDKSPEKALNTSNKGKPKNRVSLSENVISQSLKVEKKPLNVENKGLASKGDSISASNVVKPKFKKTSRRESLRLVISEDEPALFSQPDVMVKVKSDDVKKEDRNEPEVKNALEKINSSGNVLKEAQVLEDVPIVEVPIVEPASIEVPEDDKLSETSIAKENAEKLNQSSMMEEEAVISEYTCEKDDFKDLDSENSLHIDESIDKNYEVEIDENSKDQNEKAIDSPSAVPSVNFLSQDPGNESIENEESNVEISNTVQKNVEDSDSNKPIAERKPRRTIKKKEFFEDIATRSSMQTRKSGGKQKGKQEEDSKQGKRKSTGETEDSDDSSEDDPKKLWCICRQPHNNRFMIQCDKCEDWFHGSCVGISKQQGRKMEKQKIDWICPNCLVKVPAENIKAADVHEKLEPEAKKVKMGKAESVEKDTSQVSQLPGKEKVADNIKPQAKSNEEKSNSGLSSIITASPSGSKSVTIPSSNPLNRKSFNKNPTRAIQKGIEPTSNMKMGLKEPIKRKQNCIVCQVPMQNLCYCSDPCLEKHASDSLSALRASKGSLKSSEFDSHRIVVLDRVKGNVIAGDNAPTASNIVSWLKANPSFMIACTPSASTSTKQSTVQKKEVDSSSAIKDKREGEEPTKTTVRYNVRKTLKNILMDRCKNADDIQLPEEDIRKIALNIEEELHSLFKDNSSKYKSKYRSLMFNIKDPRNQGLFRKILKGSIPPDKLVRMSPEELASTELAKWREQENQHLLDMIKRVQLEQQGASGLVLKKTHKGEVEIEDDFSMIDDIPKANTKPFSVEPVEPEKQEPEKEIVKETIKDTTHHHRSHLFDLNCKICTGKILPPAVEENAPKKVRVAHSISVDLSSPAAFDAVEKTVSRIVDGKSPLSSTGDDSMDQEPTSTVSIGSPEISMRLISDTDGKIAASVWKGFIYMQDVAKFVTSAYKVSGQTEYLYMDVPDTIQVCGRIIPDQVFDYLSKIKQSGNKELIIVRFQAANEEEAATYNSFYSYLSSRKRYGVVSNYSKKIKDFYILPLAATSPVPIVLMPFDGPGLPSPRPHLLLGVIVRHKVKQSALSVSKKEKSKEDLDGSYTPPLETRSYTPPLPAVTDKSAIISPDTVYSPSFDLKGTEEPVTSPDITQNSVASSEDIKNSTDSEIYEPSYTPPLAIFPTNSPKERDDDKPYDPEQDVLMIETNENNPKSSPKESIEQLEKHKKILDDLTRQVEETDRQVNALKQLISDPEDSVTKYQSPSAQTLDINSVAATGMSSFLDIPENLQDILNVVREKSLDKDSLHSLKGDVDMRINNLFSKFGKSNVQSLNESDKAINTLEKSSSQGATPPLEESGENSPALVRPSDPRIKIRTNFQEPSFTSEEPASVSLSKMSVTELVERAEKELAEMEAVEKAQNNTEKDLLMPDKLSSSWNQYKEPPPPGIEPTELPAQDSTFLSKAISSTLPSDNSLPSSYSLSIIQDSQQLGSHFPPPLPPSSFPPPLPPGFSIQTPPPNLKSFPPPNVISTSFPPPPLPIVTKASDLNPSTETWPSWNIPPQQSKDSNWQFENWKPTPEVDCAESSSHYYPPGNQGQFYRGESSSEGRWNRPQRFRSNWNKRPARGGRWRGRRSFGFNKNQRN